MIEIIPVSEFSKKTIEVPGSKSLTNRALLLASLSQGEAVLHNVLHSDDTKYMIEALENVGVKIHKFNQTLAIDGKLRSFHHPKESFFVGNAGTAMRFLTALSTLIPGDTIITGDERMHERPIGDLVDALTQLGAHIVYMGNRGYPPLCIKESSLYGKKILMRGDMSSQYTSAVLMIAPCIGSTVNIEITGELVSKPYVDMTINMMKIFGAHVENYAYRSFIVEPTHYTAQTYTIEGDASSAGYYWALGYLHNTSFHIPNIPSKSFQGDAQFQKLVEDLKNNVADEFDMNSMPDCVQTLSILLATVPKKTRIKNVFNLRVKETDRLHALAVELKKIGAQVDEGDDFIDITGSENLHGAEIETYGDHRMAMSFGILGTKIPGMKIQDPDCVQKSYPTFWDDLGSLGVQITSLDT